MARKTQTCYIAAPINTDVKALEQLVRKKNMQPVVSADVSVAATFLEGVVNAISTADLFIAVFISDQSNDNVYLQLGIAIANERRILVVAPPDRLLMVDIAELPSVRADIADHEAISFMVDQVLTTLPRKFRSQLPTSELPKGQPIGNFADELQEKLQALDEHGRESEIIELIMQAIRESGYSSIAQASRLGDGNCADLVIWSEEFGLWIGNPLIIEVKQNLEKRIDWRETVEKVIRYLQLNQTRSALILYTKTGVSLEQISLIAPPNIFFLSIHQLLNAMRTKSFARVLIDMRNRRFHGIDNV